MTDGNHQAVDAIGGQEHVDQFPVACEQAEILPPAFELIPEGLVARARRQRADAPQHKTDAQIEAGFFIAFCP